MRATPRTSALVAAAAMVFVTALAIPATADADERDPRAKVSRASPLIPDPIDDFADVAELALPVVQDDMLSEAGRLAEELREDPQVASVGIALDRSAIEVYWYGARAQRLTEAIQSTTVPIVVLDSVYSPGALRKKAAALIAGGAGVSVAAASPRANGSGIDVSLAPSETQAPSAAPSPAAVEQRVREFAGVPVAFIGTPIPALQRQSDEAHIAGARIHQYSNGYILNSCTSAFAVIRPETGKKGLFTAAHCGNLGSTWVRHDGVQGSNSYYLLGDNSTIVNRDVWYDAAVIDTTWSYPYMYTGPWNSTTYTAINGLALPVVGTEICYSGSYTGLQCGNIVTAAEHTVDYGTQVSYAFTTVNNAGLPTVGQGDSGGPGYVLTSTSSGYTRRAATIISGIANGTTSCMGDVYPGRKCSATAFSTSVAGALGSTGWALQTYP